ncbi:MAG: nitrile hydratase subunit alpha [Geminicoccaceae bacterium]|nr:nitrile hydratase subunit alpha [Geminicoccaceae bacterium]MDW8368964.1 nitrile hydratase subunit alpha [Geminicoccaceae bacterium]
MTTHDHEHDHHHHDGGDPGRGEGGPHRHPFQPDLEDGPYSWHMALTDAVADLLLAKGLIGADELRRTLEEIDAKNPALGARLVARAWVDPAFKARLLADVNAAAAELGIDAGGIPIRAVECRPGEHHVVVCTLCSCYPRLLLGAAPDWYKARAYRSRVVREPRAVLAEFGLNLPEEVRVIVHDSTAELRFMVLPERPAGTEGWEEDRLATLVTRDCLIGVARPRAPLA